MTEAESLKVKVEQKIVCDEDPAKQELIPVSAKATAVVPTITADEVVIQYRPHAGWEKWFAHRFSGWNSPKAWFALALFVTFFMCGGPGFVLNDVVKRFAGTEGLVHDYGELFAHNQNVTVPVFFNIVFGFLFIIALIYMRHPTHVKFNRLGVTYMWNFFGVPYQRVIPWSSVNEINLVWPPGKTSPQDSVLMFATGGAKAVPLRMGAIATTDDRHNVLKAIEKWAGNIRRDPTLLEILTPTHTHGYTELWLQALSAPPKRERLTPLLAGATLHEGKYTITGQLGVGGQGTAYLATDKDSEVVLKEFILPVYVDINVRRQALEKMQHEADILSRLNNDRVVKLKDFFVEDHRGYLVLERINGQSLRQVIAECGPMGNDKAKALALQMCEILSYLQSLSPPVVHRDFTPDNLILDESGILKLVDFNVAQQSESTATGTVVGKHAYLPPEQFRGKPTTQSDLYALGATLHFLLTGDDPEPISRSRPRKSKSTVSEALDAIVAKATECDASKRYATPEEIKEDLLRR